MPNISRRQVLSSIGLTAGAGVWAGFGSGLHSAPPAAGKSATDWKYVLLVPQDVAAEAYGMYPDGSCMYAVFGAVITGLAGKLGEPFQSFPIFMMKYGKGGVGDWGSLCGTLNGAAALMGLLEPAKERRAQLVTELFCWYESTALPAHAPPGPAGSLAVAKSVAQSVLCHVSVGRWGSVSGCEVESPERKERCRRLSADVAAKTVELLNRNLQSVRRFSGLAPEVKSCVACHGTDDIADSVGLMRCQTCHQMSKKHPDE